MSTQCLAQIESFAESHSGTRVMLGPAAFADGDQLVLTRTAVRGPDGTLRDGRAAPPRPLVLRLFTGPEGCLVRLGEAGAPVPGGVAGGQDAVSLPACTCVAIE